MSARPAGRTRPGAGWFWLAALAVALGLWRWWSLESTARRGRSELAVALAETDALDPRWRWDDLEADRPEVPPEQNSLRLIEQLEGLLRSGRIVQVWTVLPDGRAFPEDLPANRLLGDELLRHLGRALAGRDEAVALARSLCDYPRGRAAYPLAANTTATLPGHIHVCRTVALLLAIDGERLLHQGRAHAAARNIHALLHTGAALRGEGLVVAVVGRLTIRAGAVRQVERLLGLAEPDEPTLAALQEQFAAEAAETPVLEALRGERAACHVLFENLETGRLDLGEFLEGGGGSADGWSWLRPSRHRLAGEHAEGLRWLNRLIDVARRPFPEQAGEWARFDLDLGEARLQVPAGERPPVWLMLVPLLRQAAESGPRDRAGLLAAAAALAAERFRRAAGRWPETLAELAPAYLPEVPLDPCTGRPLVYRREAEGVVVYSVGQDGTDNGGPPAERSKALEPGRDVGVRLWDAPRRRLPPAEAVRAAVGAP